jgi:uncharacterized membrane protein
MYVHVHSCVVCMVIYLYILSAFIVYIKVLKIF